MVFENELPMFKNWKVSHTLGSLPPHETEELATLGFYPLMLVVDWGYRQLPYLRGSFIIHPPAHHPVPTMCRFCKSLILCIEGTITDFQLVTSAHIKLFALNSDA